MSGNWLDKVLDPNSVAVVGASDDMKAPGGRVLRYMLNFGFLGDIYPVNPKRELVQGVRAWPSVAALPKTPDFAVLVVPAAAAVEALRECGERGVPGPASSSYTTATAPERSASAASAALLLRSGVRAGSDHCSPPSSLSITHAQL